MTKSLPILDLRVMHAESSLGSVLVACSDHGGIHAILLGESRAALEADLRRRFPTAQIASGDFAPLLARVLAQIEDPRGPLDLPLDPLGTAFQQRVWQALRGIPPGQTVTYRQLAEQIGAPSAARAVAGACAANPLAVVIPCHRVVRAGGELAGYRWGVERKRALLQREAAGSERA